MTNDLAYDDRTALIAVDVQNDFADPDGSLYVPNGEQIIPFVNAQVSRAREAGALVHPGLAPAVHAAFRHGRRCMAGALCDG